MKRLYKKIGLILLVSVFPICILKSQYLEEKSNFGQRLFYGGNIGLSFGYYTYVNINPIIGYRITNRLSSGIGGNYIYINSKLYNASYSLWGGSFFSSYTIIKDLSEIIPFASPQSSILLYGEYNIMNVEDYYQNPHISDSKKWMEAPMLGFALQTRMGRRSYFIIKVLYNFNESRHAIYTNPVLRVSFQL